MTSKITASDINYVVEIPAITSGVLSILTDSVKASNETPTTIQINKASARLYLAICDKLYQVKMDDGAAIGLPDFIIQNGFLNNLYPVFRRFGKEPSQPIFESLQAMILSGGPFSHFHLSGGSIRIIPPVQRWSPSSFTFACWIAPLLDADEALFCFEDDSGAFVGATVNSGGFIQLVASTSTSDSLSRIETWHPALVPDRWQFLCIRLVRGRSAPLIGRKPQVEILVDMIPVTIPNDASFDFPKISSITNGGIGCLTESASNRISGVAEISCRLGAIYLLNDRVTSCTFLSSIFEFGIDYCIPTITDPVSDNFFSRISNSLTGRPTDVLSLSCFVFAFHPRATEEIFCTDISPVDSDTGAVSATLSGNAKSYVFPRFVDLLIIQSRLFLVLLDHVDFLLLDECDIHAEIINTIRIMLSQPLHLLQIQMSDISRFFDAAGYVLMQKDARFVSLRCAEAYQQLVLQLWKKQEAMFSILRSLSNHLLRLDWWIRTEVDAETRLLLAETCRTIILGQRDVTNFDLSVLIDRFDAYTCGSDPILLQVRHQLSTAITDFNEPQYLEVLNFLDDCEHPLHTAQLAEFLSSHLNNETDHLLVKSCLDVVLACAIRFPSSYEVLIATLHCLNVIFACSSLEMSSSVFNSVIASSFPSLLGQKDDALLVSLLYRSFLELFLCNSPPGTLGVPNVIAWKLLNDPANSHFILPDIGEKIQSLKLSHPAVLFSTLTSFPDCTVVLRDIRQILHFPQNKDVLLNEPTCLWQVPLFKLIRWHTDNFFLPDSNALVFQIVNDVLSHALIFRPNAVVEIQETLACLRISAQRSFSLVSSIEKLLFPGLITALHNSSISLFRGYPNQIFVKNLCLFTDLLEEETWCSSHHNSKRKSNASETAILSVSVESNSSESWVMCSDDFYDEQARIKPLPIAEAVSFINHVALLIEIVIRFRLPLHAPSSENGNPHRCNLMQVFLNYLFEEISFSVLEGSVSHLDHATGLVLSLVELATSDAESLPGTNAAIVGLLQKVCTLLIAAECDPAYMDPHMQFSKAICKLCTDIIKTFSPYVAIQAHHHDDPLVTKVLTSALLDRRFGELQTLYVHESETSVLKMVLPPCTGSVICIPIDIHFESYSFIVHPHTIELISSQNSYSDSVKEALIQSVFSALNENSKCEQSSRSSRFADCLRNRIMLISKVQSMLNDASNDTHSNEILPKRSQRMRLNADFKQRKKVLFSASERFCEMESDNLLSQIKHFMHCADLLFSGVPYRTFWGLLPYFSCNASFILHPYFSGSSHLEATHTYILRNQTSKLSLCEVRFHDSVPSFSIGNELAVAYNPNTDVDWDLCDVDDNFIIDSDGAPREEAISIEATLVSPITRVNGILRIDRKTITFEQVSLDSALTDTKRHSCPTLEFERSRVKRRHQWSVDSLRSVQRRRYQLQHSALELFFYIGASVFFDFESPADQLLVIREISLLKPPNLNALSMNATRTVLTKRLTQQWQCRKISNFEYLRSLNMISGRTFQDLNQYPIFPWIISDYTSKSIDINNPEIYRDLSRPIGAQTDAQTAILTERYEHFVGSSIPPFHFGSHYSNAGIVIFYLLRLEPFSSLHIELQDGRFDFPDRLFSSIEQTYRVCTTNRSSVKELIPEFFTLPEMLVNCNKFDLGTTQGGVGVDNVALPPWANGDPSTFIHVNREALESEYVSANLPYWIDLIWGHKQRGVAAVEAFNVFYHLSYEGAVDLASVTDPIQREAMRSQISQWGQTPIQLFSKPHPHRDPLLTLPKILEPNLETMPLKMMRLDEASDSYVCNLTLVSAKTVMVISDDHTTNRLLLNTNSVDGRLSIHHDAVSSGRPTSTHPNSLPLSDCVVWSASARYVITGNHWDCSIRLYRFSLLSSPTGSSNPFMKLAMYTLLQSMRAHTGRVTCLAASQCQSVLISGSEDGNLLLWSIFLDDSVGDTVRIAEKPLRFLTGHDSPLICVAINLLMNFCVSCSSQPMGLIHRLHDGGLIRKISFTPAPHSVPTCALISSLGYLIFGCQATTNTPTASTSLLTYCLNGALRNSIRVQRDPVGVVALNVSHNGNLVVLANLGRITIYRIEDFTVVQSCHNVSSSFTSVTFSEFDDHVIGGTEDGKIYIYPIENWWTPSLVCRQ